MRITKRLIAIGVASAATVATGLGVATTVDGASATAKPALHQRHPIAVKVHRLKFVAVSIAQHNTGPRTFVAAEVNRHHGKVVGYDTLSGKFTAPDRTHRGFVRVAVSRKGGLLFAQVNVGESFHFTGKVTGGRGRFSGATGTVRGFSPAHSHKTFVRIGTTFRNAHNH